MNSNDNYGIESNGNTYWLFRVSSANRINFPGEQLDHIDLAALGLSLFIPGSSIVSFDSKGIPYTAYSGSQQMSDRTLTLSSGSDNESITITRNTGFIQ